MRDRPLAQITRHTPASMTRHVTTWLADAYPGLAQDATILPHRTDDGRWEITVVDRAGAIVDAPGGDLTAYVHPPSARNDWRWAIEGLA